MYAAAAIWFNPGCRKQKNPTNMRNVKGLNLNRGGEPEGKAGEVDAISQSYLGTVLWNECCIYQLSVHVKSWDNKEVREGRWSGRMAGGMCILRCALRPGRAYRTAQSLPISSIYPQDICFQNCGCSWFFLFINIFLIWIKCMWHNVFLFNKRQWYSTVNDAMSLPQAVLLCALAQRLSIKFLCCLKLSLSSKKHLA